MKKLGLFLLLSAMTAFGQTAVGNITILGATCAVTNACVIDTLAAGASSASITLTGTWTATVQFEASPDGGTTWVAINGTPPSSATAVTSSAANGVWTFNVGSMTHLRARASALASGSVGVNINASPAPIMASAAAAPVGATWGSITGTLSSQTDLQTALNLFAPIASPTFTGVPAAPTAAVDTNTTQLATTAYVVGQGYAKLASPTLTGTPTAPTAAVGTNTTQLATTAFLRNNSAISYSVTNPWFVIGTSPDANQAVFANASNVALAVTMFLDRPVTTSKVSWQIGTTADNTANTYDIGLYTGTSGGTCTLVANIGPVAGTSFAPAANAQHTANWTQGTVTIPPGRIVLMITSSAASAQASFLSASGLSNMTSYLNSTAITTGGTAPGSFTCPTDATTTAAAGKLPWLQIW